MCFIFLIFSEQKHEYCFYLILKWLVITVLVSQYIQIELRTNSLLVTGILNLIELSIEPIWDTYVPLYHSYKL